MAAFIPLVPDASSGRRGLLSQTSTPCDEEARDPHVVVLEDEDPAAQLRASATAAKISWMTCWPGRSAGWALPANTTWTGRSSSHSIRASRSMSREQQAGPLVGREPPGEADRQDRPGRARASSSRRGRSATRRGGRTGCAAGRRAKMRELALLALVGLPQVAGRDPLEALPEAARPRSRRRGRRGRRRGRARAVSRIGVADPGRDVDAVGDAQDPVRRRCPATSRWRSRRGAG